MKGNTSRVVLPLALLATWASSATAQSGGRAFTVPDWYKINRVAAPVLSPDGNTIAFTVTTVRESENKRHTEIWTQSINGGPSKRMTSPAFESTAPRWSDDGKTLFFTSTRPYTRGTQWAVRMDEGGEAFQPEGAAAQGAAGRGGAGGGRGGFGGGANNDGVQPDDKSFRITAGNGAGNGAGGRGGFGGRGGAPEGEAGAPNANDPFAKMLPMAKPPTTSITKPLVAERFDGRHITDPTYRSNDGGFFPSTGRGGAGAAGGRGGAPGAGTPATEPAQLYIQRTGGERKALTATAYSHRNPSVSPDGKLIVFSADPAMRADSVVRKEAEALAKLPPNRKRDEADRNDADLFIIDVAACEASAATCKPTKIEYFGSESDMTWSSDSKRIAFVGRPGRFSAARLQLVPATGGKSTDIQGTWKFEPGNIEFWNDGKIRMTTTTGGSSGLYAIDPATKQVSNVLGGRRQVGEISYNKAKSKIVYTSSDISHLAEIYVADADGSNEKKLTTFNDALQKEVAFQPGEQFIFKSVDGMEIEGWIIKPFGYTAGKKYPLVLNIHGGPHSAYGEGWFDEFQSQAGAGLMVLYTNPRGSSGTNAAFTNSSRGDWGGKDYQDLMKAVDIAAARPDVDSTRMGVAGGSYGGFMTAWITTKTNRFKAAETDRMISDWTSWWGMSDAQSLTNNEFFGKPWENQIMYDTLSPIRYVKNVKTPTLMVQSEEDFRTPMGNADMWYMALRSQGVPAEFVRYPRSTHELSRSGEPWLLTDRLNRINQWFNHWLQEGGPKTTTTTSPVPQ